MTSSEGPPDLENGLSDEARAAALRAGRTPIPPKFILWMILVFVVLGFGGVAAEHYFGNLGSTVPAVNVFSHPTTPSSPGGSRINSPLEQFIGLRKLGRAAAPTFTLRDQHNESWSSSEAKGRVIVLTFYNVNCNDICPVLGSEINQARRLLGVQAAKVVFAIVNTDPRHLTSSGEPKALTVPRLAGVPSVYFLTGTLRQLNPVWIHFGVNIKVGAKANEVAHNNVMYFIDGQGHLRFLAVPFGDEGFTGRYSLGASDTHRFAQGIAMAASSLFK